MNRNISKTRYPREFVEKVLESTDVLRIIGKYTTLKKSGKNFMGLCPFHKEKTPSFSVDPDRGLYYCFGCGKGGNIFSFLMEKEGFSFIEVVEHLAKISNIPIPERRITHSKMDSYQRAIETAHNFYKTKLSGNEGQHVLKYLSSRGIPPNFIKQIGFGYAPDAWDSLLQHIKKTGADEKAFLAVGLLIKKHDTNKIYDRFRNRLIIPIYNSSSRLVGFGSRTLEEDIEGPKYINSPESEIYHKSEVLFGLDHAKRAIRKFGFAVLVEGYFDVISMWIAGIKNTIAVCGTSFTRNHATLLSRFTNNVVIFLDGDDAGLKATYRALKHLLRQGFIVKIARPPLGLDPDDLARKLDKNKLFDMLKNSPEWLNFTISWTRNNGKLSSTEEQLTFVDKMAPYLESVEDDMATSLYIKTLGEELLVSESEIAKRISKATRNIPSDFELEKKESFEALSAEAQLELNLLAIMISNPTIEEITEIEIFKLYRGAADMLSNQIIEHGSCSLSELNEIIDNRAMSYLSKFLMNLKNVPSKTDTQKEVINPLLKIRLVKEKELLNLKLKVAHIDCDENEINRISIEISRIVKEIHKLN